MADNYRRRDAQSGPTPFKERNMPSVNAEEYYYLDRKLEDVRREVTGKVDSLRLELGGKIDGVMEQVTDAIAGDNQNKGGRELLKWAIPILLSLIQLWSLFKHP